MVRTDHSLETVEQALLTQYYEGNITLEVVAETLGETVAINVFLLKRSLDSEVPESILDDIEIPDDEEFYDR